MKSGWIRPEDTRKYGELSAFFKIVGRARPKAIVIRATKAYLEKTWDGDLERITSCDRNCNKCSYCAEMAKDLIRLRVLYHTSL